MKSKLNCYIIYMLYICNNIKGYPFVSILKVEEKLLSTKARKRYP